MERKVDVNVASGICVIKVTGTHRRPDDSHELLHIAGLIAKEHGCSRFLFDMREADIVAGTMHTYETALEPEKHGFSKLYRIAAVYPEITKDHSFMENVGVNRGAVAFKVFAEIDKAREWIGLDKQTPPTNRMS
jgi:hypothetical protein